MLDMYWPPRHTASRSTLRKGRLFHGIWLGLVLLTVGCSTQPMQDPAYKPDEVRARIARLIPAEIPDRQGWAADIYTAFSTLDIEPTTRNICSVLAVTQQESTFQVAPPVPGLAKIARAEIDRRASRLYVPKFVVNAALNIESPTGKTYSQRLATVRTEKELNAIFDDFIGMVPLGRQLFGGLNPVQTGGPMQVSIPFAESYRSKYPYAIDESVREEVFSRRGGMFFGIAHLLDYPVSYDRPVFRYADFNAGWYASRNAAFQHAVTHATGIKLALDGDLIRHGTTEPGATERAVRSIATQLGMSDRAIRRDLERGDSLDFEKTRLYERLYEYADKAEGKPLARAMIPGIKLESPKITRDLTTAWFANRVDERRKRCEARAGG
ncbi:Protein of unknown function [Halopseudomonas xinjiangensis]|uniref:DUF1615 domain-containing protein n=2 Tax=Halopseudomonas xinjiangensis TaxID=487184 RepID=A0A1H1TWX9_9GAMM|nr:DUF1615 domain-containing protein [Halopseudomonas xinjiangensis]SDS64601.1 Protein of unknown function [Halopseudomonas xinjiangensis]